MNTNFITLAGIILWIDKEICIGFISLWTILQAYETEENTIFFLNFFKWLLRLISVVKQTKNVKKKRKIIIPLVDYGNLCEVHFN